MKDLNSSFFSFLVWTQLLKVTGIFLTTQVWTSLPEKFKGVVKIVLKPRPILNSRGHYCVDYFAVRCFLVCLCLGNAERNVVPNHSSTCIQSEK